MTATGDDAQKLLEEVRAKTDQLLSAAQKEAAQIHIAFIGVVSSPTSESNAPNAAPFTQNFTVPEIAALCHFPNEQNGAGQTIALIELGGGYRESDLSSYFAALHPSPPKVVAVSVDNAQNEPGSDADAEVMAILKWPER